MKSHTAEKQGKEIILSIGMIVKNEEKVLERCLKSLQPLMKAIQSELIIADTGSTDSTVEIAKKYTDNVFHFDWINDFAAARNSTLEKAKGKWYFFLDADEYLDEDIHEIVEFFKIPELYNYYKCAQINLRNYYNKNKTVYDTILLPRFNRIKGDDIDSEVKFTGSIHETIIMRTPLGYFQTILHHTGYTFNSETQKYKKYNRNLELMRIEYAETKPEDRFRILSHLIDGARNFPDEVEKYITEALELAKKNIEHPYSRVLILQAIRYYANSKPILALDICKIYFNICRDNTRYIATVGVLYLESSMLYSLGQYREAFEKSKKYFGLYDNFKKEKIDISDCSFSNVEGLTLTDYISNKSIAVMCLVKQRKFEEAFEIIQAIDLDDIDDSNFAFVLSVIRNTCEISKNYTKLIEYYDLLLKTKNDNKCSLALNMMETTFYSLVLLKDRYDFASQLVNSGVNNKYVELMKLYISQEDKDFNEKLYAYIDSVDDWKNSCSEVIYLAVKNKMDITAIIDKMSVSLFGEKLSLIANTHDDFAELVLEYGVPEQFSANIKRFNGIVAMHEVVVNRCFELNDKKKYELYLKSTNLLGEYVSNIYNPELLNDEEDIAVLPPLHKFGYYMLQANNKLMNGDSIGYIKEMKRALLNCESMKEIVEFMLEQFKKNMGVN